MCLQLPMVFLTFSSLCSPSLCTLLTLNIYKTLGFIISLVQTRIMCSEYICMAREEGELEENMWNVNKQSNGGKSVPQK